MTRQHAKQLVWPVLILLFLSLNVHARDWVYTVIEGDNLWDFSERHLDSVLRFEQLRKLNNIENPRQMPPGSKIRVPMKWILSNPVPAEVSALRGEAYLLTADGQSRTLTANGEQLHLGDSLRTAADSSAAIRFADNSIITLHASSIIRFDHLSAHGTTGMVDSRLHLLEGRIDTRVTPAAGPGSRFEIHTPSAISAVRGTAYRAGLDTSSKSSIEVLEGQVAVKGGSAQKLVQAGFGTQVTAGDEPLAPVKLLPPPELDSIPARIRMISWTLRWQALDKAAQYRIELSDSVEFDTILWHQLTRHNKIGLPDLPDGDYFVRVRGIDALGLEGLSSLAPLTLDTRPQPPVQLKPLPDQVFRAESPVLQWSASSEAAAYRLEIAADAAFSTLLMDKRTENTDFDTAALSENADYFWRLTSISTDGESGPAGVTRRYQIRPLPPKLDASMQTADDGRLIASWPAGARELSYQVQLANDAGFDDLLLDQTLSEPQLAMQAVKGQVRYLRVRAIEADGFLGPWGAIQRIDPLADESGWSVLILGILGILVF